VKVVETIPTQESKPDSVERNKPGLRNNKEDLKLYDDSDDELDIKKIFMQHQKREVQTFASEKITENKEGFLQALNDPFCPPAMQFHNSKGGFKKKERK